MKLILHLNSFQSRFVEASVLCCRTIFTWEEDVHHITPMGATFQQVPLSLLYLELAQLNAVNSSINVTPVQIFLHLSIPLNQISGQYIQYWLRYFTSMKKSQTLSRFIVCTMLEFQPSAQLTDVLTVTLITSTINV